MILGWLMWGKTQVSFGTFGIYEQTNITVFAMTVAGSSAIPWRPPEAALYLAVIELCTSRLLFQSHDTLPPIILVAEPLVRMQTDLGNRPHCGL